MAELFLSHDISKWVIRKNLDYLKKFSNEFFIFKTEVSLKKVWIIELENISFESEKCILNMPGFLSKRVSVTSQKLDNEKWSQIEGSMENAYKEIESLVSNFIDKKAFINKETKFINRMKEIIHKHETSIKLFFILTEYRAKNFVYEDEEWTLYLENHRVNRHEYSVFTKFIKGILPRVTLDIDNTFYYNNDFWFLQIANLSFYIYNNQYVYEVFAQKEMKKIHIKVGITNKKFIKGVDSLIYRQSKLFDIWNEKNNFLFGDTKQKILDFYYYISDEQFYKTMSLNQSVNRAFLQLATKDSIDKIKDAFIENNFNYEEIKIGDYWIQNK